MQITRATDYAVRVMIQLATLDPGGRMQQKALAQATGVPESFLSKLLQRLARAGRVTSSRGLGGGFALAMPASEISMLDVLEIMEGTLHLNTCVKPGPSCSRKGWCPGHVIWWAAQKALTDILRGASMATLAQQVAAGNALAAKLCGSRDSGCAASESKHSRRGHSSSREKV